MASTSTSSRLSPVKFDLNEEKQKEEGNETVKDTEEILSGAKLASGEKFKGSQGREATLTPVIIDFRRVIQSKSSTPVVAGVIF